MKSFYVIFDFDGTLVHGHQAILEGVRLVMSEHLQRQVLLPEVQEKYSAHLPDLFAKFGIPLDDQNLRLKLAHRWSQLAFEMEYEYKLFPGISQLLHSLEQEPGYKIALWTARDRRSTLKIKEQLGLRGRFFEVRCGDDTEVKPSPRGLQEICGDLPPQRAVVIGDSFTDIRGAQEFGAYSIGAAWCPHCDRESLERAKPNYIATSPQHCLELIKIVAKL